MSPNLPAEDYLLEFARDLNAAVANGSFNTINVFTKRTSTDPQLGDIYDIDIGGPDNGSIVLVAISEAFAASTRDSWFRHTDDFLQETRHASGEWHARIWV